MEYATEVLKRSTQTRNIGKESNWRRKGRSKHKRIVEPTMRDLTGTVAEETERTVEQETSLLLSDERLPVLIRTDKRSPLTANPPAPLTKNR